jgi:hypothetical protein
MQMRATDPQLGRAGTRAIPPTTRIISNTNNKKFMIALRCLLDESDQWVRSAAEHSENEGSQITHNHDWVTSDLFLAGV